MYEWFHSFFCRRHPFPHSHQSSDHFINRLIISSIHSIPLFIFIFFQSLLSFIHFCTPFTLSSCHPSPSFLISLIQSFPSFFHVLHSFPFLPLNNCFHHSCPHILFFMMFFHFFTFSFSASKVFHYFFIF